MPRLLLVLAASLAAAAACPFARGQTPSDDAAWLRAELAQVDPVAVAWAAHKARELGDRRLVAPLQEALRTWRTAQGLDERRARLCVLDALFGLGAKMPATDLVPLLDDPECGNVAFALLAAEPVVHQQELLDLLRHELPNWNDADRSRQLADDARMRSIAAANLLTLHRAPGVAGLLASHLEVDLEVVVGSAASSSVAWGLTALLGGEPRDDDHLPPRPVFHLRSWSGPKPGPTLLADGPAAVRLVRRVASRDGEDARDGRIRLFDLPDPVPEAARTPLAWLRELAGDPPEAPRVLHTRCDDAQQYVAEVLAARDRLQQSVDQLREGLVKRGAMTADEAKVLDRKVRVVVRDERADGSPPLPDLPPAK